jgi:hypothetical protein
MLNEMRADMSSIDGRLDRLVAAQDLTRQYLKMAVKGHAVTQALIERSFAAVHALIDSLGDPAGAENPSRAMSQREPPGPLNPTVGR